MNNYFLPIPSGSKGAFSKTRAKSSKNGRQFWKSDFLSIVRYRLKYRWTMLISILYYNKIFRVPHRLFLSLDCYLLARESVSIAFFNISDFDTFWCVYDHWTLTRARKLDCSIKIVFGSNNLNFRHLLLKNINLGKLSGHWGSNSSRYNVKLIAYHLL